MHGYAKKLPDWFRTSAINVRAMREMRSLMGALKLNTICESAGCPNRHECFAMKTATFLILGDTCTRSCRFCSVNKGRPLPPDPAEPEHIVQAIEKLDLRYTVITSVSRDDLPDGGASHFKAVIDAIHSHNPEISIEVLIPDFSGSFSDLEQVVSSSISVLNHNVETVPRLYKRVRPEAEFERSLSVLKMAREIRPDLPTKSGLMLGLGETEKEVLAVMEALKEVGCSILTLGQYLQPSKNQLEVVRFVDPGTFSRFQEAGEEIGFSSVISGPRVRSSYHAASAFDNFHPGPDGANEKYTLCLGS